MKVLLILALSLCSRFVSDTGDDKVIICKGNSSYAYHSHYCQGLKQCSAAIEKVTIEEAKKLKRKACGYCYGNTTTTTTSNSLNNESTISSQCRATTKKGTRCSRNAKSGGYCWQHG